MENTRIAKNIFVVQPKALIHPNAFWWKAAGASFSETHALNLNTSLRFSSLYFFLKLRPSNISLFTHRRSWDRICHSDFGDKLPGITLSSRREFHSTHLSHKNRLSNLGGIAPSAKNGYLAKLMCQVMDGAVRYHTSIFLKFQELIVCLVTTKSRLVESVLESNGKRRWNPWNC